MSMKATSPLTIWFSLNQIRLNLCLCNSKTIQETSVQKQNLCCSQNIVRIYSADVESYYDICCRRSQKRGQCIHFSNYSLLVARCNVFSLEFIILICVARFCAAHIMIGCRVVMMVCACCNRHHTGLRIWNCSCDVKAYNVPLIAVRKIPLA